MTKTEFSRAVMLAQSDADLPTFVGPGSCESLNRTFEGFGLPDFQVVDVTIVAVAALVRHQCVMMNCELDPEALQEVARVGRHKFNIVGFGADSVEMERNAKPPDWYAKMTD